MDGHEAIVRDVENQLNEMRRPLLNQMVELWKTMGLTHLQEARIDPMLGYFKEKFEALLKDDQHHLNELTRGIERQHKERMELRRILSIEVDDTEEENLSLIDVEKKIRDDVSQLKKEKEERMKDYEEAREAEEAACEATGSNPSYIVINRMPTDEQVRQIKDHTKHLKELRKKREVDFDKVVTQIHEYYKILETEPGNSERNIVCSEAKSFEVLSQDMLDKVEKILQDLEVEKQSNEQIISGTLEQIKEISETLNMPFETIVAENCCSSRVIKQLKTELNALEEERKKHMAVFIQDAADKLQQIWEKCYVSDYTKEFFMAELDTKIDEESQLSFYQENIKEWTQYYSDPDRLRAFSKIEEWYSLWDDRLKLETCMKDPKRLGNFKALREEEKMRKRVNTKLPKAVDEIMKIMSNLESQGKEFKVRGMTFDELNEFQEAEHDRQVQEERNQKKAEKSKIIAQESVYGIVKTPNRGVVGKDKTMNKVKRLQHDSKVHSSLKVVGAGKTFATPGKPKPATPGSRRALKEKNETFVRGMTKASIASVDGNIFNAADIASSTMKADQIRKNLPTPKSSTKKYNTLPKEKGKGLRSGSKIPFVM